jgi:hypothetical protein
MAGEVVPYRTQYAVELTDAEWVELLDLPFIGDQIQERSALPRIHWIGIALN